MQLTCGANIQTWMTLYLKSLKVDGIPKYSTASVNVLPTIVGAVVSSLPLKCSPDSNHFN